MSNSFLSASHIRTQIRHMEDDMMHKARMRDIELWKVVVASFAAGVAFLGAALALLNTIKG